MEKSRVGVNRVVTLISWDVIYRPINEEGLEVLHLQTINSGVSSK